MPKEGNLTINTGNLTINTDDMAKQLQSCVYARILPIRSLPYVAMTRTYRLKIISLHTGS